MQISEPAASKLDNENPGVVNLTSVTENQKPEDKKSPKKFIEEERGGDGKKSGEFFNTIVDKFNRMAENVWNSLENLPAPIGTAFKLIGAIFKILDAVFSFFESAIKGTSDKIGGKGRDGKDANEVSAEQESEMALEDKRPFTKSVDRFFNKFFGKSESEKDGAMVEVEHGPDFTAIKEVDGVDSPSPSSIVFNFLTNLFGDKAIMKQLSEIDGVSNLIDTMSGAETGEEFLKSLKLISEIPEVQYIISGSGEDLGISAEDVTKAIDSTIKDPTALEAVDKAFLEHKPQQSIDNLESEVDEPVIEDDNMNAALAEVRNGDIIGGLKEVELSDGEVDGTATDGVSAEVEKQRASSFAARG